MLFCLVCFVVFCFGLFVCDLAQIAAKPRYKSIYILNLGSLFLGWDLSFGLKNPYMDYRPQPSFALSVALTSRAKDDEIIRLMLCALLLACWVSIPSVTGSLLLHVSHVSYC